MIINAVLLAILMVGTIAGLVKGLIHKVVELVGVVASFFIAILFAGLLANALERHVSLPYSPSLVIAFLALFIGGMIGFHFLALSIQKLIRMTFLGWVDRLCGAMLGLIIGMVVTSLLITVTLELPVSREVRVNVERSSVSMFVRPIAPWLFNFVFSHGERGVDFNAIFKRGGLV
jgi:membrane protein required for colicin V production